ncbi:cyclic nucleotide-binding domain-containing protein [Streptococcus salivarius]|uniref:Cyclic nucleotide-binding domain-containing protein n=1 Tax=Streptococcus salivarius TaxID=1304 RepID=A0A7L6WJ14_STRSL|nr:cyclic nucleotide-binding domain-containing protein [Streptococcus salivarius]QMI50238.1 cyclic nucleotide-binding domain-containing protein [Streptococcus salivarius]
MRNHAIRPQLDQVFPPPYLSQLQKVTFQKNDYICTQGQAITELTYILSGKVKIVRSLFNGKEHILETLNQPQILGDVELMTNQPAGSSVIALEDVQAVQLPLNNKEELLKDPVFLYQIGRNLAMALHKQGITASTNASYSVKERLATHILNSEEENIFQLSPSILASRFGTSYRHVQRVIKQFIDQGIIKKEAFKTYRILERQTLEKLAFID